MRFCLKASIAVLVLLIGAAPLRAAEPKTMSEAELRAAVVRLQGVVAGCAAAGAKACDASSVGDDVRVGDPAKGGYEVHWGWLRDSLEKSKTADATKRSVLLKDSRAALERMAGEFDGGTGEQAAKHMEFEQAQREAKDVLAQPEFLRAGPTWWDRLKARFFGWIYKMFQGLADAGSARPWLGPVLEWALFAAAAIALVFFLLRQLNRQRLRVKLESSTIEKTAWDREAKDWQELAAAHAARQEWRDAVHCLYWAAIVNLEAKRAWRHNPTRTPREYVRLLKAGSAQQKGLRGLTRIFERVWYGLRDAQAEEYAEAKGLYESLASVSMTMVTNGIDGGGRGVELKAGGAA